MRSFARGAAAALAAAALAAAPAAAQTQTAPPTPAGEHVDGSALRGGDTVYWLLPALVIVALLIAITAADGSSAKPASP